MKVRRETDGIENDRYFNCGSIDVAYDQHTNGRNSMRKNHIGQRHNAFVYSCEIGLRKLGAGRKRKKKNSSQLRTEQIVVATFHLCMQNLARQHST